jgi:hypothetical protein
MLASSSTLSLILLVVPAKADPEPTLQEFFNSHGLSAIDATPSIGFPGGTSETGQETWPLGTYAVVIAAWYTASSTDSFGWYHGNPKGAWTYYPLFQRSDAVGTTKIITVTTNDQKFGFYLDNGHGLGWFFTENSYQPENSPYDHAWVYQHPSNPNMVFVCFEDSFGGGDCDHNDLIVNVTRMRYEAVGGIVVPVDKFGLLAPYIGLASTILAAAVASTVYVKRVKRKKEKQ